MAKVLALISCPKFLGIKLPLQLHNCNGKNLGINFLSKISWHKVAIAVRQLQWQKSWHYFLSKKSRHQFAIAVAQLQWQKSWHYFFVQNVLASICHCSRHCGCTTAMAKFFPPSCHCRCPTAMAKIPPLHNSSKFSPFPQKSNKRTLRLGFYIDRHFHPHPTRGEGDWTRAACRGTSPNP